MTTHPPTNAPGDEPTHHCVNCQQPLHRDDPDWPWKDPQGKWRCSDHPDVPDGSRLTPHVAAPGA